MPPRAPVVDEYSFLSHKVLVGHPDQDPGIGAPTWCPRSERRRIRAQLARGAYLGNVARDLLPADTTDKARAAHREYGDPATFVRRIVAAVLGDDWTWVVDGADEDLPDEPDLPPEPGELPADASPLQRRIHANQMARWAEQAEAIVDQWEADWAAQPALRTRQAEYLDWAERENVNLVVHEVERDIVGIGNGCIILWHQANDWPRPERIPPEGCFPIRDEHDDGRFPRGYHFAWEYEHEIADGKGGVTTERRLRRITFELELITNVRAAGDGNDRTWVGPDGEALDGPMLRDNERIEVDRGDGKGYVVRTYPWDQPEGATDRTETAEDREPSRYVCLYSDGTWPLKDLGDDVMALDESRATWRPYGSGLAYRADYGIDFLPVLDTEGEPVLDVIAQVLDDLASADTAAASAAQYLGKPTVALENATLPEGEKPVMMPGRILTGKLTPLDMSKNMPALGEHRDSLRDRAAGNIGLPGDLLGKAKEGGPESGFSKLVDWIPFAQLVGEQRMTRKHTLFAKMAQRMAQVQSRWDGSTWVPVLPPGPTPTVRLAWGSFLPTDRAETLRLVAEALKAHAISLQTAVALLVAGGVPIDDARAEIDRIRAEDVGALDTLADALAGHPDLLAIVSERAGVPAPTETPVVELDPVVPDGGGA